MNIGSLRHRITFQSETKVSDSMGGFSSVWGDEITTFAAIWPTSANEQIQAMQTVMTITHRIRIRYRDIKPYWRIKYGDKYYAIVSIINPNMANRYLDIMAKEAI